MGIGDHGRFAEDIAANQICGFPADARQLDELFHRIRNDPAVFVAQHPGHRHDVPRLGFVQTAGMDDFPDLLHIRLGERLKGRVAAEQGGGDQIDSGVGALCGQAGRNQQLQRVGIGKRANGVGIAFSQAADCLQGNILFLHGFFHPLYRLYIGHGNKASLT